MNNLSLSGPDQEQEGRFTQGPVRARLRKTTASSDAVDHTGVRPACTDTGKVRTSAVHASVHRREQRILQDLHLQRHGSRQHVQGVQKGTSWAMFGFLYRLFSVLVRSTNQLYKEPTTA